MTLSGINYVSMLVCPIFPIFSAQAGSKFCMSIWVMWQNLCQINFFIVISLWILHLDSAPIDLRIILHYLLLQLLELIIVYYVSHSSAPIFCKVCKRHDEGIGAIFKFYHFRDFANYHRVIWLVLFRRLPLWDFFLFDTLQESHFLV